MAETKFVSTRNWLTAGEAEALADGLSPVEFLINTFRDEGISHPIRMEAAKSLLPYISKRAPQAIEVTGANGGPLDMRQTSVIRHKLADLLGVQVDG